MKILIGDFLSVTLGLLIMLTIQGAIAKQSMEEQRAKRRATEIVYHACLNECFQGCRK